ncbi:MAG: hypothetical protein J5742_03905 [Alphaproteobacteria bacterium]|nr:hypothetical protein [Alphaproteobacteria bacterium]
MKKLFVCGVAAALIAGCSEKPKSTEVKVLDASCEKIATFEQGDFIVKCPVSTALQMLQTQTPNARFVQAGDLNLADLSADADHIYVDVIPAGAYDWAEKLEYRVMVKEPNFEGDAMWAIAVISE